MATPPLRAADSTAANTVAGDVSVDIEQV